MSFHFTPLWVKLVFLYSVTMTTYDHLCSFNALQVNTNNNINKPIQHKDLSNFCISGLTQTPWNFHSKALKSATSISSFW